MANHGSRGALHIHLHSLRDLLRIRNMYCRLYLGTVCLIFILASFHFCDARGSNLAANQQVGEIDLDNLRAFQKAADENGVLSMNWTSDQYCTSWEGVLCQQKTGRVSHIYLPNKGLNGTIPENTLGNLTELQYLDIANNALSGPFPNDLINLNNLVHFLADDNQFSGPFPNLSTTSTISVLDLSFNSLSGPITLNLTDLIYLTSLNLSNNQFSGSVPLLPSNLMLNMSYNNFTQISPGEYSTYPNAFQGDNNLCVGNVTYCAYVQASDSAPAPVPSPSSNPVESGKNHLSVMSIIFITLGVLLALLFLLGYGRHFYLTRFQTPGGAYYYCFHSDDMEKSPEGKSPSPPADSDYGE